jgi:diguanylate cyclase (GGDEF)-like protein
MEQNSFEAEQKIYVSAMKRIEEVRNGTQFNFEEFVAMANSYGDLLRNIKGLLSSNLALLEEMQYDALTGIYNRRYMEETFKWLIRFLSRAGGMLGVMMLDIDFFKNYNDTYGHSMGDACLKSVAKSFTQSASRAEDFAVRYGGEEFVVVLPNTDAKGTQFTANKVLEGVRALNIPHKESSAASYVTVSIGCTAVKVSHTHNYINYTVVR